MLRYSLVPSLRSLRVLRRLGLRNIVSDVTALKIADALDAGSSGADATSTTPVQLATLPPPPTDASKVPPNWNGDLLVTYTMPKEQAVE